MNFDQDPALSADSPYEETHIPYLPLPSDSPQQPASQPSVVAAPHTTPLMSTGAIILLAGILTMLTATMLLMQQKNREHRTALFASLLK